MLDISKLILLLLYDPSIDSLDNIISKDIEYFVKKNLAEEGSKTDIEHYHSDNEIYDGPINIFASEYISAKKVNQLQDQIHKLCKCGEEFYEIIEEKDQKYKKLEAKYDSLYEEYKNQVSIYEQYKEKTDRIIEIANERIMYNDEAISSLIRSNIEEALDINETDKHLITLLQEILDKTEIFDSSKHLKLISILEKALKILFLTDNKRILGAKEFEYLKEPIVDFLYRFKDKHPFSNLEEGKTMDVLDRVMQFMKDNSLKPSEELINEYSKSEATKSLNELPTFTHLKELIEMKREVYDKLKERYQSMSPFVYYFSFSLEIQTKISTRATGNRFIQIGYFKKDTNIQIGAGIRIFENGQLDEGYFKNNKLEYFGRSLYPNGDSYIGGWKQSKRNGKGEYVKEDGRREIGYRVDDKKEGECKYFDRDGKEYERFYKDGELVEL